MTQDKLDQANSLRMDIDMAENFAKRIANRLDCARLFLINASCFDPLGSEYCVYLSDREEHESAVCLKTA